jgi:hypothetical protein
MEILPKHLTTEQLREEMGRVVHKASKLSDRRYPPNRRIEVLIRKATELRERIRREEELDRYVARVMEETAPDVP